MRDVQHRAAPPDRAPAARPGRAPRPPATAGPETQLQRSLGNRGFGRVIQARLKVGAPDDAYEREADRVAEQVMRMPAAAPHVQRACASCAGEDEERVQRKPLAERITPLVQRQPAAVEVEEDEAAAVVQAKEEPGAVPRAGEGMERELAGLRGAGRPLPASERGYFEPRFGYDFGGVRLHTDGRAAGLARSLHARAFTTGADVVFGAGEYAPGTEGGRRLMAHELTHVVQQAGSAAAPAAPGIQRKPRVGAPDDAPDREPEPAAAQVMRDAGAPALSTPGGAPAADPSDPGALRRRSTASPADVHAVQPKLSVSIPGDPYEREADQVAEHVVRRLAAVPGPHPTSAPVPDLQRACAECKVDPPSPEEEEEDRDDDVDGDTPDITPKRSAGAQRAEDGAAPEGLEDGLRSARGGGSPLPPRVRQGMERGFGEDFGHVRVHTGGRSSSMNRSIQARAFTHGGDIFFNQGEYAPGTDRGRFLLAHELAHVVQQTGSRPIPTRIQRAAEVKIGNWAHSLIQERLRRRDDKLITEAPVPGGTRQEVKINVVGFADLYKAERQTVSGIAAQEPAESKDLEEAYKHYKYVNMRSDHKAKAESKSAIRFGPRIRNHKKDVWDFDPNFPANFQIGEIKPLFLSDFPTSVGYHGTGFLQTGNYREGFRKFIERVYRDNPKHQAKLPPTSSGRPLNIPDAKIPDSINYGKFESEHGSTGKDAIVKRDTRQRVWIYRLRDGVYVYFLLPETYTSKEFPAAIERQLQRLDPLLERLRKKRPKMGNTLMPKRDERAQPLAVVSPIRRGAAPAVQRKGVDRSKEARAWEESRREWVRGAGAGAEKPKEFLKKHAKGVRKKGKIDKELGLRPTGRLAEQVRDVGKIGFWSSSRGRILGALRFRFASAFDSVEAFFGRMKERLRGHRTKSNDLVKKGGIFSGWKKVATSAIIRFAVEIFKEMLAQAFRGFVNCINGLVEAVQKKFTAAVDGAREDLTAEIEPVCCQLMEFKERAEAEYEQHEKTIASFTEAIETIREWREILDKVEIAVRVGVQAISCGTPPALGCLWGLVAQLGISTGLSLLARTDYFEDEIAKPAARTLMDAVVGDSLHNFLIQLLEDTPLKPYLAEAAACRKREAAVGARPIGGNLHKLDPNDPQNARVRAEWEREHEAEILKDLQAVFEKGRGRKPGKNDFSKLLQALQKTDASPEELKRMLEGARNPLTGKLALETATANVEKGEAPEAVAREREFDHAKAVRSNEKLQQIRRWTPHRFYAKPGIKADSVEFAEAVYDLQEALGVKRDGILGEGTVIAFYERNGLTKDAIYDEAVRIRDEATAAREAAKAERERAAPEPAPAPTYTVLNGPDHPIRDPARFQDVPRGVNLYLHSPDYRDLVAERRNPGTVTLDLYVNGRHTYRIHQVTVRSLSISELLAVPDNIPMLTLTLADGLQLTVEGQEVIVRELTWRTD